MNQIASLLGITNTNPPEGADRWIPIEQWPMHQPLESPFGKPLLYGPNKTLPGQFNYEKLEAMPTAGNTGISVKVKHRSYLPWDHVWHVSSVALHNRGIPTQMKFAAILHRLYAMSRVPTLEEVSNPVGAGLLGSNLVGWVKLARM